jgi:ribosomal protein S18 acetylase RimI-like enzyme
MAGRVNGRILSASNEGVADLARSSHLLAFVLYMFTLWQMQEAPRSRMAEISYRYAVPADAAAVRVLIERCYRGSEAARGWTNESDLLTGPRTSEVEVLEFIADPDTRFLLAEIDGALVGCVLLERRGDAAYFGMFSIDPGAQSGGLGKAVLAQAEAAVREIWGARAMTMVVINLRQPLIEWYQRRGYRLTGHTEPFPFGPTTGETRRDFHLLELRKEL